MAKWKLVGLMVVSLMIYCGPKRASRETLNELKEAQIAAKAAVEKIKEVVEKRKALEKEKKELEEKVKQLEEELEKIKKKGGEER